jgi:seryl-tRNA synthetase
MNRIARRRFLEKLAAKSDKVEKLRGKKNRKDVEKQLAKLKKQYTIVFTDLKNAKQQVEKLNSFVSEHEEKEGLTRSEMKRLHDILKNMDFSGAEEVRMGSDEDDVAYIIDGKAKNYNADTHEVSDYKRKKEQDDVNDVLNIEEEEIPKELDEGLDINIGDR